VDPGVSGANSESLKPIYKADEAQTAFRPLFFIVRRSRPIARRASGSARGARFSPLVKRLLLRFNNSALLNPNIFYLLAA
jgi:hypothetical protein